LVEDSILIIPRAASKDRVRTGGIGGWKIGAIVAGAEALIGMILSFWLPEPREEKLEHGCLDVLIQRSWARDLIGLGE